MAGKHDDVSARILERKKMASDLLVEAEKLAGRIEGLVDEASSLLNEAIDDGCLRLEDVWFYAQSAMTDADHLLASLDEAGYALEKTIEA